MAEAGSGQDATPATGAVPRVLVFFDYACPFCYLDWPRFKRLREEHGVELMPVPFELRPGLSQTGVSIDEIGGGHSEHVEAYMRRMAEEGGLELAFPDFVPNTHLALVLGEMGRDAGPAVHEPLHEAIFAAYNGRQEDIGARHVLFRIAEAHGLDRDDAANAFAQHRYDERLHQFYHLAAAMEITATPAALICNELMIGSRPYEVLEAAVDRCLVGPDNIETTGAGG